MNPGSISESRPMSGYIRNIPNMISGGPWHMASSSWTSGARTLFHSRLQRIRWSHDIRSCELILRYVSFGNPSNISGIVSKKLEAKFKDLRLVSTVISPTSLRKLYIRYKLVIFLGIEASTESDILVILLPSKYRTVKEGNLAVDIFGKWLSEQSRSPSKLIEGGTLMSSILILLLSDSSSISLMKWNPWEN